MAITPYLYDQDVSAALKWLARAFGFKAHGVKMRGPDGTIRHAAMRLGDDIVMMGAPGKTYKNPKRIGQATQSLYVTVKDADQQFKRATKAGGNRFPAEVMLKSQPKRMNVGRTNESVYERNKDPLVTGAGGEAKLE